MVKTRKYKTLKGGKYVRLTTLRNELTIRKLAEANPESLGVKINNVINGILHSYKIITKSEFPDKPIWVSQNSKNNIDSADSRLLSMLTEQYNTEQYNSYYDQIDNPNKLTPAIFEQMLMKLLKGEIFRNKFGEKLRFINDDNYRRLYDTLSELMEKMNEEAAKITSEKIKHITAKQKAEQQEYDSTPESIKISLLLVGSQDNLMKGIQQEAALYVFEPKSTVFANVIERLKSIEGVTDDSVYMCCVFTIPNGTYNKHQTLIERPYPDVLGYEQFDLHKPIWRWEKVPDGIDVTPNPYCVKRTHLRKIILEDLNTSNIKTLKYTRSPYVHEKHSSLLIKLQEALNTKDSLGAINKNDAITVKVDAMHLDPDHYFNEVNIFKKEVISGERGYSNFSVVICKIRVYSQDGICNSELMIIISIKENDNSISLPGQPIFQDQPHPPEKKSIIIIMRGLMVDNYNELTRKLRTDSFIFPRINLKQTPAPQQIEDKQLFTITPQNEVIQATDDQKSAFYTVSEYIGKNKSWDPTTGLKEFSVSDNVYIKVDEIEPDGRQLSKAMLWNLENNSHYDYLFMNEADALIKIEFIVSSSYK
jgi:hypothetical protein